jgi:ribose transport system substrate-binding protein
MSDQPVLPPEPKFNRTRLMILVVLLAIAGLVVYFGMVRDQGPKHLKLALVTWTEDPFWEPLIAGAQECAGRSNVDLRVIRCKPDVAVQTQQVRELLNSGIDGMAISPNDPTAQRDVLEQAASKVPLVTFDSDAPETKRRRFVGIDNYAAGRVCADQIREALPEGGPVLISVGSATMQHGRDRRQGLIDDLLERGFDRTRAPSPLEGELKGSRYSIVATVTDGADPKKAVVTIAEALRAHPEVKCIAGLFSYSAPAALEAMKQVGRSDLKVVGFDESDETQAAIEAGTIHSSVLQDSYHCGYELIDVLTREARGVPRGPAEQSATLYVGISVLTADNLLVLRNSGTVRRPAGSSGTKPASL